MLPSVFLGLALIQIPIMLNKNKKCKLFEFPDFFVLIIDYIRQSFYLTYRQTEGIIEATGKRLPANNIEL